MHRIPIFVFLTAALLAPPAAHAQLKLDDSSSATSIGGLFDSDGQDKNVVAISASFTAPADGKPGELFVTAKIAPGWHIYSITQPPGGPIATKIKPHLPPGVQLAGKFVPSVPPDQKPEPAFDNLTVETHHGTVVWHAPLKFASGVDPAKLKIPGNVMVQPCDANSCLAPRNLPFTAALGERPIAAPKVNSSTPNAKKTFNLNSLTIEENEQLKRLPIGLIVLMAFVGGLILNIMPCVLPVIGLKLLSFMEQADHRRGHALLLNIWYSLGLISVFLVLATLAVTLGFGWGQLFSYSGFNITLAAVVFTMGLSFLGVWEMPIPGFAGRGKVLELAEKEGALGAFSKGVLTTVLATPCGAPFLASALTWAVTQPPGKAYAVFCAAGVGMASPYLLIGAFPNLIGFLPKPGAWMDTFKELMGFVLLGTVAFLLTFMSWPLVVPTVGFLFGLWAACWWVGRISPTADAGVKMRSWLSALAFAGVIWLVAYGWLAGIMRERFDLAIEQSVAERMADVAPVGSEMTENTAALNSDSGKYLLPWRPFTRKTLEDEIAGGSTVMVDFTADWCLTCKTLEMLVLNTQEIHDFVAAHKIVTLRADWTHGQPEVTKMLELLGSKQVPVLAIFPSGDPNHPVVLRGGYTKQTLLDVLQKAVSLKQR